MRYIKDTKLPAVEAKLKSLKDDIRKRLSKKQKESLMAKIKKLTKEMRALKSEESKLNKHKAINKYILMEYNVIEVDFLYVYVYL